MTTLSAFCKSNGFKSATDFSRVVDVPVSTLYDWRKSRPQLFSLIVDGIRYRKLKEELK